MRGVKSASMVHPSRELRRIPFSRHGTLAGASNDSYCCKVVPSFHVIESTFGNQLGDIVRGISI